MTSHLLRGRLIAWRRAELELTELVAHVRRGWPDPEHELCDALLDRLDAIDAKLDAIRAVTELIECDLRVNERGVA